MDSNAELSHALERVLRSVLWSLLPQSRRLVRCKAAAHQPDLAFSIFDTTTHCLVKGICKYLASAPWA